MKQTKKFQAKLVHFWLIVPLLQERMSKIESRLLFAPKSASRQEEGEGDAASVFSSDGDQTHEKSKLLWQKAGVSALSIKKQYDEAKEEYKGNKMAMGMRKSVP